MPAAQTCNPLGAARSKHKHCGCQLAIASLSTETRFASDNILLPVLAKASVYKDPESEAMCCDRWPVVTATSRCGASS